MLPPNPQKSHRTPWGCRESPYLKAMQQDMDRLASSPPRPSSPSGPRSPRYQPLPPEPWLRAAATN